MKFINLKNINFNYMENSKALNMLKEKYYIDAPDLVIEQFYIDHSDKEEFQDLYGNINIHRINWLLTTIPTELFIPLKGAATHPEYLNEVADGVSPNKNLIDNSLGNNDQQINQWHDYGTWAVPPILIHRALVSPSDTGLHLVEGHTRVGKLCGIAKHKLIPIQKYHKVYIGRYKDN